MAVTAAELQVGMIVVGSDGERLGVIKAIEPERIRVDVRMAPDVEIPLTSIETVAAGLVILTVPTALTLGPHEHAPRHL